jgi:guanylate kinase
MPIDPTFPISVLCVATFITLCSASDWPFVFGLVIIGWWANVHREDFCKPKRIILVGPACGGKDYLRHAFSKFRNFKLDVSVTTRKMRDGELRGYTYNYIDHDTFVEMKLDNKLKEYAEFGGFLYGTTKENWDTCNVFIMNPDGLRSLYSKDRLESYVVYLNPNETTRFDRLHQRPDFDKSKITQRLDDDHAAFRDFHNYDMLVDNPFFDAEDLVRMLSWEIQC